MARFLIRSIVSTVITLFLVSILLFAFLEIGTGDITVRILGVFSTPEQRESFRNQLGLDAPAYRRYLDWLIGSDARCAPLMVTCVVLRCTVSRSILLSTVFGP